MELSATAPLGFKLPQYDSSAFAPKFTVPEFHPTPTPAPYVTPVADIVKGALSSYEKARDYRDAAPARMAAEVADRQFLQSQGVDISTVPDSTAPSLGSRALASVGHLFDGTLGGHGNDPKPGGALANLKPYDPNTGAFSVGPSGATFQTIRPDPSAAERVRGLQLQNDALEAENRLKAAPMQGTVHPFSGQIMGGGAPALASAPPDPNALPAAPSAANPSALTAPGGNAAPAPAPAAGVETVRTTNYDSTRTKDPQVDPETAAGLTATGAPLVRASPTIAGTVAVDPAKYAYGTIFRGQDGKTYVAGDTGGAVKAQTASGGKAPVVDIFGGQDQPDYQKMTVIPPTGDYAKLSAAEKEQYHRRAAATYGSTNVTAPAPAGALANVPVPGASAPAPGSGRGALAAFGGPATLPPERPLALAGGGPSSFDAGPPVGIQDKPVRKALAVVPEVAARPVPADGTPADPLPATAAPATAPGPHGGTLQPNGNEETPYGTILNPAVYGQRTVRRVELPGGGVQVVDDPNGKFFAPYVKAPVVADAVIDPATGQPIPGLTMVNKQITSRGAAGGKAAPAPVNMADLTPEQQFQARALTSQTFGRRAGADPANVNLVASLLRDGHDRNEIRTLAGDLNPQLRVSGQYNSDPQVKTYLNTVANYQTVKDIAEKPGDKRTMQDDLSLMFAYVKADNPTMGVTEGSFKTAAAAGTFGDSIQRAYNQLTNTNQRLTPQQVEGFKNAALSKLIGQRETYNLSRVRYSGMAEGAGAEPEELLGPDVKPFTEEEANRARGLSPMATATTTAPAATAAPVQVHSQAEYDALPGGTRYLDSNGKLAKKP